LLTIVGCTFAELNGAQQVCDRRHATGDTTQGRKLLLGRLPLVVCVYHGDILLIDGMMGKRGGALLLGANSTFNIR
jgi:hypothetical protein